MRFDDVLALQSTKEVPTQAVARRVMAPRSRTDPMLEVTDEAQDCFKNVVEAVRERLRQDQAEALESLHAEKVETLKEIEQQHSAHCEAIRSKGPEGKDRQSHYREQKCDVLQQAAVVSTEALFFQLHDVNQVDSLKATLHDEVRYRPDALPVHVRIVSRNNENFGAHKWNTPLSNTPENFYDLLMGTADDEVQSDHFPDTQAFAQGQNGCFMFSQNATNSYEESNASGDCPYAAIVAVSFHNSTDENKTCSVEFSLSSRDFAGVYCKIDTWETLFQTTSESHQTGGEVSFSVPPQRDVFLMAVATPAYYRSSTGRRPIVHSDFVRQYLHVGLTHLKEVAVCLSH